MTRRGWWLFATVAVLWGLPYLFIRVAVHAEFAPVVVVWLRTGGAAIVLLPFALHRGALRGLIVRWRAVLALTLMQVTAPFLLITYGEQRISSSLAGLLVAAEPLLVVLLVAALARARRNHRPVQDHPARPVGDRVDGPRAIGLVLGILGVAALLGIDVGGPRPQLLGAAFVLLAALLYAGSALLIRRLTGGADPVGVITAILTVNTVLLTPAALPALPARLPDAHVAASLAALALLCTAVAFVAYFALIAEVGPTRGTVVFYATPVVTVAAGALVLGERLTASTLLGLLLIVAGSGLATIGFPRRATRDTHDPPSASTTTRER